MKEKPDNPVHQEKSFFFQRLGYKYDRTRFQYMF